jgi:hypothetical protein
LYKARGRAKAANVECSITVADIEAVWPKDGRCPVLGVRLRPGQGRPCAESPTLDRLDNDWPYVPGNIVVMSHRANVAKRDFRASELEQVARWMRAQALD